MRENYWRLLQSMKIYPAFCDNHSFVYQFEVLDDRMSSHSFPWWSWVSSKPLAWIWIFLQSKQIREITYRKQGLLTLQIFLTELIYFLHLPQQHEKHSNQIHHSRGFPEAEAAGCTCSRICVLFSLTNISCTSDVEAPYLPEMWNECYISFPAK